MEQTYTISLPIFTREEFVSIWYQLWELPFFRSFSTQVKTSDPETYGEYTFPAGMPMPVFEGMVRSIEPMSFIVKTPDFRALLNLPKGILYLSGSGALFQQIGPMLQSSVPRMIPRPYTTLTLAYNHTYLSAYRFKPNAGAVMLMRMQNIVGMSHRLQWAHLRAGEALQSGPLPEKGRPYLIMVSDETGRNVIVCDANNDRLAGFGNVPDLLQLSK